MALLRQHGSMEQVELMVAKYKRDEEEEKLEGGCFTKIDLEKEGWTEPLGMGELLKPYHARSMIENSKIWAQNRGLLWRNEVYGEEEWRIPLRRSFSATSTTGREIRELATASVQDRASAFMTYLFQPQDSSGSILDNPCDVDELVCLVRDGCDCQVLVARPALRKGSAETELPSFHSAATATAAAAKLQPLPVLQANQDPYSFSQEGSCSVCSHAILFEAYLPSLCSRCSFAFPRQRR